MSQGPLCPNLTQKVQKEVSQMANCNFSPVILLGGLSVNLNHLKCVAEATPLRSAQPSKKDVEGAMAWDTLKDVAGPRTLDSPGQTKISPDTTLDIQGKINMKSHRGHKVTIMAQ